MAARRHRRDDGKRLWSYVREPAYDDVVIATPVVHDNLVFTSVGFHQGCDLIQLVPMARKSKSKRCSPTTRCKLATAAWFGGRPPVRPLGKPRLDLPGIQDRQVVWAERDKLGRGSVTCADGWLYCCGETASWP